MLGISKRFAKSKFQTFEPNSEIGAINELIKLLQTSPQHSTKFRGGNFKHFKTSKARKVMNNSPLCHKVTYIPQMVAEGQGRFA